MWNKTERKGKIDQTKGKVSKQSARLRVTMM
jgi:hypothetical protein